jgi:hypothetical protein
VSLFAEGTSLRAGSSAVRGTADALENAARQVEGHAGDAAHGAGHDHVRAGLEDFAQFHRGVLNLLALAVEAVAQEIDTFDDCMARTDRDLAAGC